VIKQAKIARETFLYREGSTNRFHEDGERKRKFLNFRGRRDVIKNGASSFRRVGDAAA